MASWIKMRTNLLDDPRVRFMAKQMKCHAVSVVGMLHTLWSLADEHTTDGRLFAYDSEDLSRKVGHAGFAKAVADPAVGWLEIGDGYLQIVRFEEHNGESAKKRAQAAKRQHEFKERYRVVTQQALPDKKRKEKNKRSSKEDPEGVADADQAGSSRREPSGPHHELIRCFCDAWKAKYQADYVYSQDKGGDGKHFKTLLDRVHRDPVEACRLVQAYFADDDPYLIKGKHPPGLLVSRFNKYRGVEPKGTVEHGNDRNGHAGRKPAPTRGMAEGLILTTPG